MVIDALPWRAPVGPCRAGGFGDSKCRGGRASDVRRLRHLWAARRGARALDARRGIYGVIWDKGDPAGGFQTDGTTRRSAASGPLGDPASLQVVGLSDGRRRNRRAATVGTGRRLGSTPFSSGPGGLTDSYCPLGAYRWLSGCTPAHSRSSGVESMKPSVVPSTLLALFVPILSPQAHRPCLSPAGGQRAFLRLRRLRAVAARSSPPRGQAAGGPERGRTTHRADDLLFARRPNSSSRSGRFDEGCDSPDSDVLRRADAGARVRRNDLHLWSSRGETAGK